MKRVVLNLLLLVLVGEIITLGIIRKNRSSTRVLAETVTATPIVTPTIIPTPTETPTPSPTPIKTPKPTPKPTPIARPRFSSQEINGFIDRFGAQYGVSPHVLRKIALCESGFNSGAYNSGYGGLYQFGATTWKNLRKKMGEDPDVELRFNAEEAVQTAAYALGLGKSGLWPNCAP